MTEESFQQARKIMKTANWLRGRITAAKDDVIKWTRLEDHYRTGSRPMQADAAKINLEKYIKRLEEARKNFADIKFPDSDIVLNQEISTHEH